MVEEHLLGEIGKIGQKVDKKYILANLETMNFMDLENMNGLMVEYMMENG